MKQTWLLHGVSQFVNIKKDNELYVLFYIHLTFHYYIFGLVHEKIATYLLTANDTGNFVIDK